VPLQSVDLPPHVAPHVPAEHAVPLSHLLLHAPQLPLSVCVSTQLPPHDANPVGHAPSGVASPTGSWPLRQQVRSAAQW
jgi:hypothetical protein